MDRAAGVSVLRPGAFWGSLFLCSGEIPGGSGKNALLGLPPFASVGIPRLAIVPYYRYREHCRVQVILKKDTAYSPTPVEQGWHKEGGTA